MNDPTTCLSSVNAGYISKYLDRANAMARVEDTIEHQMKIVLEDWKVDRDARAKGVA
jgi:hypothetical protein